MSHTSKTKVTYAGKRYMVVFGPNGPKVFVNVSRKGVKWSGGAVDSAVKADVIAEATR